MQVFVYVVNGSVYQLVNLPVNQLTNQYVYSDLYLLFIYIFYLSVYVFMFVFVKIFICQLIYISIHLCISILDLQIHPFTNCVKPEGNTESSECILRWW